MIEFLLGKISGDDLNLVSVYKYESTVRPDREYNWQEGVPVLQTLGDRATTQI